MGHNRTRNCIAPHGPRFRPASRGSLKTKELIDDRGKTLEADSSNRCVSPGETSAHFHFSDQDFNTGWFDYSCIADIVSVGPFQLSGAYWEHRVSATDCIPCPYFRLIWHHRIARGSYETFHAWTLKEPWGSVL